MLRNNDNKLKFIETSMLEYACYLKAQIIAEKCFPEAHIDFHAKTVLNWQLQSTEQIPLDDAHISLLLKKYAIMLDWLSVIKRYEGDNQVLAFQVLFANEQYKAILQMRHPAFTNDIDGALLLLRLAYQFPLLTLSGAEDLFFVATKTNNQQQLEILAAYPNFVISYRNEADANIALLRAAALGHDKSIQFLLGDMQLRVNTVDGFNRTALHLAACKGHANCLNLLINDTHIDVDAEDSKYGFTALQYAAFKGRASCLQVLLVDKRFNVNAQDEFGLTPLLLAVKRNHVACVRLLVADPRTMLDTFCHEGFTALRRASYEGYSESLQILLAAERIDVNDKGTDGSTTLMLAAERGHLACVDLLLADERTEINARDQDGKTAFILAVEKNRLEVVKAFLNSTRLIMPSDADIKACQNALNAELIIYIENVIKRNRAFMSRVTGALFRQKSLPSDVGATIGAHLPYRKAFLFKSFVEEGGSLKVHKPEEHESTRKQKYGSV